MNPLSVLIIDDEEPLRSLLIDAISDRNYNITAASNGQEALDKLSQKHFDLAICDVMMPIKNGLDFLRESKYIQSSLITIMVSALNDVENIIHAIKEGAYHFLLKPIDLDQLSTILNDIEYKKKLEFENQLLKSKLEVYEGHPEFLGTSSKLQDLLNKAFKISSSEVFCLITGEAGTGKAELANLIHKNSNRKNHQFFKIDCSTFSEKQIESELFGYERGAIPGAYQQKPGLLEQANSSTLCISKIECLPLSIQGKLVRSIESNYFLRIGGHKKLACDFRLISTSSIDLKQAVIEKKFREDLYYKLNVLQLHIPPLRERVEDIPLLINHFLKAFSKNLVDKQYTISNNAVNYLLTHPFDNNISELKHLLEQAINTANNYNIDLHDIFNKDNFINEDHYIKVPINQPMNEIEKLVINKVLDYNKGDKKKTADMLNISVRKIFYKLKEVKESTTNQ